MLAMMAGAPAALRPRTGPSGTSAKQNGGKAPGAHAPGEIVGGGRARDDARGTGVTVDVDGDVVLQHLQRRGGRSGRLHRRPAGAADAAREHQAGRAEQRAPHPFPPSQRATAAVRVHGPDYSGADAQSQRTCCAISYRWGVGAIEGGRGAAGGLDPGHTHWISIRADFFLPVRVLAEVFRGKLLSKLETAIDRAEIPRPRDEDPHARLKRAAATRWVVYCKPPFAGPEQVLAYLARYTHRIALSNDRLVSLHEGQVTFRWKDPRPRQRPPRQHAGCRDFSAPLPAPRPASPLRAHPPLWLAGQLRAQAPPAHGARGARSIGDQRPLTPGRRARHVGGHVASSHGPGRHPLSVLRGGGLPHRRRGPGASGAGRPSPPRQKPMSSPALRPFAMLATPEDTGYTPTLCPAPFQARTGFTRPICLTISRLCQRRLPSPSPRSASNTPLPRPPAHHQSP